MEAIYESDVHDMPVTVAVDDEHHALLTAEHVFPVPVRRRMLLPEEWVGCDGEEVGPVGGAERAYLDERAAQRRLQINSQGMSSTG